MVPAVKPYPTNENWDRWDFYVTLTQRSKQQPYTQKTGHNRTYNGDSDKQAYCYYVNLWSNSDPFPSRPVWPLTHYTKRPFYILSLLTPFPFWSLHSTLKARTGFSKLICIIFYPFLPASVSFLCGGGRPPERCFIGCWRSNLRREQISKTREPYAHARTQAAAPSSPKGAPFLAFIWGNGKWRRRNDTKNRNATTGQKPDWMTVNGVFLLVRRKYTSNVS